MSDDVEFDSKKFEEDLKSTIEGKLKPAGGRKPRGGATPDEIRAQLGKLHEDDPELMRIAAAMALSADDASKWRDLRAEFTARKRAILLERGSKDTVDAAIAASEAVLDAAQKLAAAGGKAGGAIGDFARAVASGFQSLVETCGNTAALVVTNVATARFAFGLGESWAETHSVQGVADDYLEWVRAMTPFDAALAGAGAVLAAQVASNSLLSCVRRRAAAAPAAAAAVPALENAPAGPGQEMVLRPRRNSRWGPAPPQGGRRTRRRHRRRLSAPTRKGRRSSYGGRKHYSRQTRG